MNNPKPMPGDAVIHREGQSLINPNSTGIIDGIIGEFKDEYLVVFNFTPPFRGKSSITEKSPEFVSTSGGPAIYIPVDKLKRTDMKMDILFWKWRTVPMKDGGEYYKLEVPIWLY